MSNIDETAELSAEFENRQLERESVKSKSLTDYFSLAITTFGVGYLPLAPGTWGSIVGVGIYLLAVRIETILSQNFIAAGLNEAQTITWIHSLNSILFLFFCFLGIWASNRATILFRDKDPSQAVVDEVIGQLITFLFVPFALSGWLIFAGFSLFRLFDIWKPYPVNLLEKLPAGLGICADDILAGVYAGICLLLIYSFNISFF